MKNDDTNAASQHLTPHQLSTIAGGRVVKLFEEPEKRTEDEVKPDLFAGCFPSRGGRGRGRGLVA